MIDSHCHLYLEEYREDIDQVISKATSSGVSDFYLPAINSDTHASMIDLENKYPACHAMMGLHPCYVKENYQEEIKVVKDYLANRPFCAIGEIGLDYYWDTNFKEQQLNAFRIQIELALQYSIPIVIHSRNATRDCIEVVKPYAEKGLKGIFHCFGGTVEEANDIIHCGFLLGIGGVVTYKNSGLTEVLHQIDISHLVLETDAPYLTPVPYRGKRNESAYLVYIAQKIAEIKNLPVTEVERVTDSNTVSLFQTNRSS